MIRRRRDLVVAVVALVLVAVACAQEDPVLGGPPVGDPVLPDLVPAPPVDVNTKPTPEGGVEMRFSSTLVNVGEADFLLSGTRSEDGAWAVIQEIPYSESGIEEVPTVAEMVWGGDGHDHWHVERVAVYWLEALDENGESVEDFEARFDTKVGFCFFDSHHQTTFGPPELVYDSSGCGEEGDDSFRMGLSVGWSDVYDFSLPGQSVDITDLPDGNYRLWAEADQQGWFREANHENNITWVDLELFTLEEQGLRAAKVVEVGPEPG